MPTETTTSAIPVPDVLFETIQLLHHELRKHYGADYSYIVCANGGTLAASTIAGIVIPRRAV